MNLRRKPKNIVVILIATLGLLCGFGGQEIWAVVNFCGGQNVHNDQVSYSARHFSGPSPTPVPINGVPMNLSVTKGLAVRDPIYGYRYVCPNTPAILPNPNRCSPPWESYLTSPALPQTPYDCACPTYLRIDLLRAGMSKIPQLPQNAFVGFWFDPSISSTDVNNLQNFPDMSLANQISYGKFFNLSPGKAGQFSPNLGLMVLDKTSVGGTTEIKVLVPYRNNIVIAPNTFATFFSYGYPDLTELTSVLVDCMWASNPAQVKLLP